MKHISRFFRLRAGGVCVTFVLCVSFLARPVRADSFNVTNCLAAGVSVVGWPTNSASTNGLTQATGGPIGLANVERAGFFFQCQPLTNTSTSTLTVQLVRSCASNPPSVSPTNCDWETSPGITLSFTIPPGTNPVCWFTNLDPYAVGFANWLGVYSLTNATTGTNVSYLTNLVIGLNKKILPIRYP
jgi:hypothetical protein